MDPQAPQPSGGTPSREQTPASGAPDNVRRALEDVLQDEAQGITDTLGAASLDQLHYEGLESAIRSGSNALSGDATVSLPQDDGTAALENEGGSGLGAAELEQLLDIYERADAEPMLVEAGAQSLERAQILLHVAAREAALQSGDADSHRDMGLRIDAALRDAVPTHVQGLLMGAIPDMAEVLDPASFDRWMEVAYPFLSSAFQVPMESLVAMAVTAKPGGRECLAPYVVDEYLAHLPSRMPPLDERVFELDPAALDRVWERLGRFRALGQGLMRPGAFRLSDRFAHPLMLRLVRTPLVVKLAPFLAAAFRESMPADAGARFCVLAWREPTPDLGWVLGAQLEDTRAPLVGVAEQSAAWVLVQGLETLEHERRGESWLAEALGWLGERDASRDAPEQLLRTRALLAGVVSTRNGLFKSWPSEARRAAKASLRRLPKPAAPPAATALEEGMDA